MAMPKAIQLIALRNLPRTGRQINQHSGLAAVISQSISPSRQTSHTSIPIRQFTTSNRFQAPGDKSTIDFAFLPDPDVFPEQGEIYRVPILHNNFSKTTNTAVDLDADAPVMKPEISTMAADAVFTPMADLSDGHAENIDFHAMADRVAVNLRNMKIPAEEQASIIKQLWSDIVDDLFTKKNLGTPSKG